MMSRFCAIPLKQSDGGTVTHWERVIALPKSTYRGTFMLDLLSRTRPVPEQDIINQDMLASPFGGN